MSMMDMAGGIDPASLLDLLVSHGVATQHLPTSLYPPRQARQTIPMGGSRVGGLGLLPVGMGDDSLSPQVADSQNGSQDAAYGPPAPFDPTANPQVQGLTMDPKTGMYSPVLKQSAHPGWEAAAAGARAGLAGATLTSPYAGVGANIAGGLLGGILNGGSGVLLSQAAQRNAENTQNTNLASELNTDTIKNQHAQALAKVRWDAHRAAITGENGASATPGVTGGDGSISVKVKNGVDGWTANDKEIGDRMISGELAPTFLGNKLSPSNRGIANYLAHMHYDHADAVKQFTADMKAISTANSPQQYRLRQAIGSVMGTLDRVGSSIDDLASRVPRTNSDLLNQGIEGLATQGILGSDAKDSLQRFRTASGMSEDELAQTLSSGGVPSQKAFDLAHRLVDTKGSVSSIRAALDETRALLGIRKAALNAVGAQGIAPGKSQFPGGGFGPQAPTQPMLGMQPHPLDSFVTGGH